MSQSTPSAPGAATGGPADPPDPRAGQPRDRGRPRRGGGPLHRRRPPSAGGGGQRHLRRGPAAPLREHWAGRGTLSRRGRRRAAEELMAKSLFDKIWEAHEVDDDLIYIDLHLVHEVTSAQAFEGLRLAGRSVRRPDKTPCHRRPQRAHRRDAGGEADRRRALAKAGRGTGAKLRGVRHPDLLARLGSPRDRPRDRARARRHPAWDDDRLRGLPHRHPRRLRGARNSASAPPRSSTCWRPSAWSSGVRRRCGSATGASWGRGSPPRT